MAQLVARLVRNEKVGGSNPPSSTTDRHPIADVGFLYAWARSCGACCCVDWCRWCSGRLLGRVVGPGRCVCRWAAARPRAVCAASFARRVAAKPGQAPPPPTGTASWPVSRSPLWPPTTHRHRGQAIRTLHIGGTCGAVGLALVLSARTGTAARPSCRPPVWLATLVKPSSPVLACALSSVKPTAPLRGICPCFRRYFGAQRRHGFHGGVQRSQ